MELRQLIQLKRKGYSNRKVAQALGISRNTVNTYVRCFSEHELSYEQLEACSEAELSGLFPQVNYTDHQRYQQLATYFPNFGKELQKPGCTLQVLWKQYLCDHPDGYQYTQFTHHFRAWAKKTKVSGILEHKVAEKLFIDFAGKTLSYVDRSSGEVIPVQIFVAILPSSQYTYVKAVHSQKREDVVGCVNDCLWWMGGVPKAIVSDNLKAVVAKGHKYAPYINKTFKDLALHYQCVVDPTRPYRPQDKALVEGAVKLVYQRIYYPLSHHKFFSLQELNQAIAPLVTEYNTYRFQHRSTSRHQQFLDVEASQLSPLPAGRYQLRYYKRAKVQKISHVYVSADKNYYSVPHRYIGCQVEVQYNSDIVEIFYNNERIASHGRSRKQGHYTTTGSHMPSAHQVYNDWNPAWFARRAGEIGPDTQKYITRLIGQYTYPEIGYKQAMGILALVKHVDCQRVEAACHRGLHHQRASYRIIQNILDKHLDQLDTMDFPTDNHIPEHQNIRGSSDYQ